MEPRDDIRRVGTEASEEVVEQHGKPPATQPSSTDHDFSEIDLKYAANMALPASGSSSLRQLQESYGISRADDIRSLRSASGRDVAVPASASSSLLRLEGHEKHNRPVKDGSSTHSTSAWNMPLPASASSSLQALARLDSNLASRPDGPQEWTFPLPQSRRSSLASVDTIHGLVPALANGIPLDTLPSSSLEQLQAAPAPCCGDGAQHAQPGSFPLPPSPSGSDTVPPHEDWGFMKLPEKKTKKMKGRTRQNLGSGSYARRVAALVGCMPHLSSLQWTASDCRDIVAGGITIVDFRGSLDNSKIRSRGEMFYDPTPLRKLLETSSKRTTARLLIVEDLSPNTIEILGSVANVDPEAFASQLSRGRPSKSFPTDDEDGRWNTSGMTTSSASIQWYRPVRLGVTVAGWLKDLSMLRRLLGVSFEKEEDVCLSWFQKQVKHWKREQYGMYGITGTSRFVSQRDIHHNARITTNIFRRSWLLSTNAAEASRETVPTAWEEKATMFRVEKAPVPTRKCVQSLKILHVADHERQVILFVDPLPAITDTQIVTETRLRLNPVPTQVTRDPTETAVDVEVFLPFRIRVPLELPTNKLNINEDEIRELRKASEATSTAEAVQSWLSTMRDQTNPILALLEVVRLDSIAFFDILDAGLKEISEDSMDDYLMTRRLADWRQLLNDFESKVREIGQSLHDFIDFAFGDPATRPDRVDEIIEELDSRTQRFSQRIEKAYAALRAEMGLFESRRSIAEAETVTKLTELAFVFIPLTFCCGLFSMQVTELQKGVPLRTFIITAIIVFVICYGARIIMRSSIIVESMQSAQESLWAAGKMKPGSPIPTRLLVWITLKEAWKRGGSAATYLVFLFVLSFTVIPVAFLWTTVHLGSGLNVMIMLLLVPIGIAVAWFCATAYTEVSGSPHNKVPLALRIALWVSEVVFSRRVKISGSAFSSAFSSPEDSENGGV